MADIEELRKEEWIILKAPIDPSDPWSVYQFLRRTAGLHEKVIPSPQARARADEIVQANDKWLAKYKRRPPGMRAAERRANMAGDASAALRRRINATRAVTLEGLIAKARCVPLDYIDGNLEPHLDDWAFEDSVVVDLLSMKGATA